MPDPRDAELVAVCVEAHQAINKSIKLGKLDEDRIIQILQITMTKAFNIGHRTTLKCFVELLEDSDSPLIVKAVAKLDQVATDAQMSLLVQIPED